MKLHLLHGWGFDRTLWDALAACLPEFECVAADRGYFGAPADAEGEAQLAVGHSLGALLLLGALPPGCRGLVAINGFDRFTASAGAPGVPARVVQRMLARFAERPGTVLAEFRARCGAEAPPHPLDRPRLEDDLRLLRDADARPAAAALAVPVLLLHGDADPILPADMRAHGFTGTRRVHRGSCAGAGHLLPVTHPDWCAAQLRGFAAAMA